VGFGASVRGKICLYRQLVDRPCVKLSLVFVVFAGWMRVRGEIGWRLDGSNFRALHFDHGLALGSSLF